MNAYHIFIKDVENEDIYSRLTPIENNNIEVTKNEDGSITIVDKKGETSMYTATWCKFDVIDAYTIRVDKDDYVVNPDEPSHILDFE